MNDFKEERTQVDVYAAQRARDDFDYERRRNFHLRCWEMEEFCAGLKAKATNFSDSFDDGYDTVRMPVVRRRGLLERFRALVTEVWA